jgi:hypothetical protein
MSLSLVTCDFFTRAIAYGRTESFRYLLSLLTFEPGTRNIDLSSLLRTALEYGNTDIANIVISQNFQFVRNENQPLWTPNPLALCTTWKLPALKKFISDHNELAAELVPTMDDFKRAYRLSGIMAYFELARHCEMVSHQKLLDPTAVLVAILKGSHFSDRNMVPMARRLLEYGALVDDQVLSSFHHHHFPETLELLKQWGNVDVKTTEEDAANIVN